MTTRALPWILIAALLVAAAADETNVGGFAFTKEIVVPVTPEEAFDAFTGDVLEWWDHTMSGEPKELKIEPVPGGRFVEVFDDEGNGAVHATVTYADRGKTLRMVGPLGLAGYAFDMAMTLQFVPDDEGTRVKLMVRAAGEMEPGWDEAVEQTWEHFLVKRYKPYVEGR